MVNRNLIRNLENDDALSAEIEAAMAGADSTGLATLEGGADVDLNKIVEAVSYTHLTLPTTPYV